MSQCERILEHLLEGNSLTPAQAYAKFGTLALHSRAAELRERGHRIVCTLVDGHGVYTMAQPEQLALI